MCSKLKMTILVTIVMLCGFTFAEPTYTHSSGTGDWNDPATWVTVETNPIPTWNGDYSNPINAIIEGGVVNVVGSGQQGAGRCSLRSGAVVNVYGTGVDRDFNIGLNLTMGDVAGDSTLNVFGDGTIAYCEMLRLGEASGGSGTININNGATLMHGGWGTLVGISGTGTINLIGTGSMFLWDGSNGRIQMNGTGKIDIEAGKIEQNGDLVSLYQSYVDNGWITAYGGSGVVKVELIEGWTIVTAMNCSLKSDFNHDCYVDFVDFSTLVQSWLTCYDPQNPECLYVP